MKSFFSAIALLIILLAPSAVAAEIVAVLSSNAALYRQTAAEIDAALAGRVPTRPGPRSISASRIEILDLSQLSDPAALPARLRGQRPRLILALGGPALAALAEIDDIPVFYLFAPNGPRLAAGRANLTGINLTAAPADQLAAARKLLPTGRRVGLITVAGGEPVFLAAARQAAADHGFSLAISPSAEARLIPPALEALAGRIDLFWLTPEGELLNRQYLQAIMLFALRERVPVLAFSELLLKEGAALAVSPDLAAISEQAARMIATILGGGHSLPPPRFPERVKVMLNPTVVGKLGLSPGALEPAEAGP